MTSRRHIWLACFALLAAPAFAVAQPAPTEPAEAQESAAEETGESEVGDSGVEDAEAPPDDSEVDDSEVEDSGANEGEAPGDDTEATPETGSAEGDDADGEENAGDSVDDDGANEGEDGDEEEDASGGSESDNGWLGEMPDETDAPDAARGLASPIPRPSGTSPEEYEALDAFERALRAYEAEVNEYRDDINRLIRIEYDGRRQALQTVFDREIGSLRNQERDRRQTAIERLQAFVERYPNHPPETPDALFRLAELYFEKESDEFVQRDEAYSEQLDLYDLGRIPDLPEEPRKDYTQTIATFQRLVDDFPDYRQVDGAYYLLGYALLQMNQEEAAVGVFTDLVRLHPESDFAQEAWVRIGEYHFEFNEYETAAAAYQQAIAYGEEGRLYDEAVFKLGWAYYLMNDYQESLDTFVTLIRFYEGNAGSETAGALREEALQYMAVVLSEEDWDIDGEPDGNRGMGRVREQLNTGEEWELDVLDRLTEVWFENERYDLAIEGFRHILDNWPLDRRNPERHERIVAAMSRERRYDEAFAEQAEMGELYRPGSSWYVAQEADGNFRAMAYAEELARRTLLDSARYYNQQADLLRDQAIATGEPGLDEQALAAYDTAAEGYRAFLETYPADREAYEVQFLLAQALYYSLRFADAAAAYRDVAAAPGPRQELASFQVVKSLEAALVLEIEAGRLEPRALPNYRGDRTADDEEERDEPREAVEEPLPQLSEELVAAYDNYVAMGLNSADDPTTQGRFAYLAAKIFFDHGQFEEARRRFEAILENPVYRAQEESLFAASLLIDSFRIEGDFQAMEEWTARIQQLDFGGEGMDTSLLAGFLEEAEYMRLGSQFLQAEELFQAEDYEAAALEYVAVVNSDPQSEFAAAALNNAAVAYERIQRYEPAMRMYQRVVDEYPNCEFYNDALQRVAFNSRRFFDFERATNSYTILANRPDVEEEDAINALFSAAELQEYSGRLSEASATFEDFAGRFPDNENAAIALYRAGISYEQEGRYRDMVRVWQDLRNDYGGLYASEEVPIDAMVVDSLRRTADYYADIEGDRRAAERAYNEVLDEYTRRNPTDVESAFSAGKAQFWLSTQVYDRWNAIQIEGNLQRQRQRVQELISGIPEVVESFNLVPEIGSAEWTMAAYFMIGRVYQAFADKLYDVEVPASIADDPDLSDAYQLELEDVASRFEDEAVSNWEIAIELARRTGVVNEWTISIIRELNRYRGSEYPLFKEEPEHLQEVVISAPPPLAPSRIVPRGGGDDFDQTPDEGFDELDDFDDFDDGLEEL